MELRPSFSLYQPALIIAGLLALLSPGSARDKKGALEKSSGASSELQRPVLGFVLQDSLLLRPVVGVVGAAVLGEPLSLPEAVNRLAMSPLGTFAIAEMSDGLSLSVLPIRREEVGAMLSIPGAFRQGDRIEFSVSGSTAAIYSASTQRIQVIVDLPESATVKQELDISSVSMPVTALAVNDDGSMLLVGVSDGQGGALYRLTSDNSLTNILAIDSPSALRFLPGADSALVGDSALNQVLMLSTLSGKVTSAQLAGADQGVSGPNRIEMLAGNRTAVIANSTSSSLLLIDLRLGSSTILPIFAPAVNLQTIRTHSGLALSTAGPPAHWLLGGELANPVFTLIADPASMASRQ